MKMKIYVFFLKLALLSACSSESQQPNIIVLFFLDKDHNDGSGMIFHKPTQNLWMLQDKGNPSELYVYSTERTFEKTITINNQKNTDWEDLSQDTQGNIYIGDFGNNKNERKDLRILKLHHETLNNTSIDV